MEKLNLKRDEEDIIKIQVNEKGEYIEIDTTDIGLIERMIKASDDMALMHENYIKEVDEILNNKKMEQIVKIRTIANKASKYCDNMNEKYDSFLGEGASKKIFQGRKSPKQYEYLAEALEPIIKGIPMNMSKGKKQIADKYLNGLSDIL